MVWNEFDGNGIWYDAIDDDDRDGWDWLDEAEFSFDKLSGGTGEANSTTATGLAYDGFGGSGAPVGSSLASPSPSKNDTSSQTVVPSYDGSSISDPFFGFDATFAFSNTADSGGVSVEGSATGTATVAGLNQAPVALTASIQADEDYVVSGELSASDADSPNLTFALLSAPSQGFLTIDAGGTYTFNPLGAFDTLNDGETQSIAFTYSVSGGAAMTEWTSNDGQFTKIRPLDASGEEILPMVAKFIYDSHELEGYLENVGSTLPVGFEQGRSAK